MIKSQVVFLSKCHGIVDLTPASTCWVTANNSTKLKVLFMWKKLFCWGTRKRTTALKSIAGNFSDGQECFHVYFSKNVVQIHVRIQWQMTCSLACFKVFHALCARLKSCLRSGNRYCSVLLKESFILTCLVSSSNSSLSNLSFCSRRYSRQCLYCT